MERREEGKGPTEKQKQEKNKNKRKQKQNKKDGKAEGNSPRGRAHRVVWVRVV